MVAVSLLMLLETATFYSCHKSDNFNVYDIDCNIERCESNEDNFDDPKIDATDEMEQVNYEIDDDIETEDEEFPEDLYELIGQPCKPSLQKCLDVSSIVKCNPFLGQYYQYTCYSELNLSPTSNPCFEPYCDFDEDKCKAKKKPLGSWCGELFPNEDYSICNENGECIIAENYQNLPCYKSFCFIGHYYYWDMKCNDVTNTYSVIKCGEIPRIGCKIKLCGQPSDFCLLENADSGTKCYDYIDQERSIIKDGVCNTQGICEISP